MNSQFKLPARRLRLGFFGTPELARIILDGLLTANEDDVVLVLCQPDRRQGRGQKRVPPPVKERALLAQIPVLQPTRLKDGHVAAQLREYTLDLAIVVAYGRILPKDVFLAPQFGSLNIHASLLPRHRGAAPIQQAILDGDAETGVTLMQISEGLDEGPMLAQAILPLNGTETSGSLGQKLAELGQNLMISALRTAKTEGLEIRPQPTQGVTYAALIEKKDGILNWAQPAAVLERQIRAFQPWPGAQIQGAQNTALKVLAAREFTPNSPTPPGTLLALQPQLLVATGAGTLELLTVQPAGKRPMSAADYLRGQGRQLQIGHTFSSFIL